jgi:hypothetical protein
LNVGPLSGGETTMTKWERFELGWRFFWFGLIVGLVPTVFRAQATVLTTLWCCFGWTLMYLPAWIATVVAHLRRKRSQSAAG